MLEIYILYNLVDFIEFKTKKFILVNLTKVSSFVRF